MSEDGTRMVSDGILNAIRAAVGIDGVSNLAADLRIYSADLWPRLNILKLHGKPTGTVPDAVVWPRSSEAVGKVLAICSEAGIPVIPFGGGSGVCGGTLPVQGGVTLDLKRMNRIVEVDELSMSVDVEAGMIGQHLETALNERGYTLGHFPSSIMCSTVGGWVATRSAGQFSSRYGKIEDMVLALEMGLSDGSVVMLEGTRTHLSEPDFPQLFLGSEGTLGVVTRIRLRVYPAPSTRRFGGFRFMDVVAGLEAMRNIMQSGLRPAVMRLYDPLDTLVNSFSKATGSNHPSEPEPALFEQLLKKTLGMDIKDLSSALTGPLLKNFLAHPALIQHALDLAPLSCLLVVGFEGDSQRTRENIEQATEQAARATGRELGPGPGEHWMAHRYSVSFKLSKVFGQGAFAETLEVAGLWRDVPAIYRAVRKAVMNRVSVMAHFSHAYREGCALYFTFSGYDSNGSRMVDLYDSVIRRALSAAMAAGATVSHHHGIGVMKRAYMPNEYRGGERLFWAVKLALDPYGIMNPGKVYPSTVPVDQSSGLEPASGEGGAEFDSVLSWEYKSKGPKVVNPEVPEEIPEILKLARKAGRGIVCQGPSAPINSDHTAGKRLSHVLDLSRMDEILDMDPVSGTVTLQAGMSVLQLENFLREKGFSLGLVPKSRLLSSFGEFLASSSPSKGSPLYGTIQENCLGLSAVLADGTPFSVRPCPRRSAGPDLMHCFLGAGGRYGVITGACVRVFPVPTVREAIAYATNNPVMAVSAVRTILVRQARPEKALMVIRAPSKKGKRRRVRIVFQFGGDRASVSSNMSVVRSVMESLGMEGESVRAEERMTPGEKRSPAIERFLSMDRVMALAAALSEMDAVSCPEAHITDFAPQGATLRLLLRQDCHEYPESILDELDAPPLPDRLAAAADRLKEILDPEGILNPENDV